MESGFFNDFNRVSLSGKLDRRDQPGYSSPYYRYVGIARRSVFTKVGFEIAVSLAQNL